MQTENELRGDAQQDEVLSIDPSVLEAAAEPEAPTLGIATDPYPFDQNEFTIHINALPARSTPDMKRHTFRKPTFPEEEARERLMPYDSVGAGKVEGREAISYDFNENPANIALYDRVILNVGEYDLDETIRRFAGNPVAPPTMNPRDYSRKLDAVAARRYDETYTAGTPIDSLEANEVVEVGGELKLVKQLIPGWHKTRVIGSGLYGGVFEIDAESTRTSLGAKREWRVRHEIGGGRRGDGTIKPPQYVIVYTFLEPSEAQQNRMHSKGANRLAWSERGGAQKDRITANLNTIAEIFAQTILSVEGGVIGDRPVDVKNPKHLSMILGNFKKLSLSTLFRNLQAEAGK